VGSLRARTRGRFVVVGFRRRRGTRRQRRARFAAQGLYPLPARGDLRLTRGGGVVVRGWRAGFLRVRRRGRPLLHLGAARAGQWAAEGAIRAAGRVVVGPRLRRLVVLG